MAFGPINSQTSTAGQTCAFDVPLNYKILNARALLSPCAYWEGAPELFIAENSTVTGEAAAYCTENGVVFKMLSIDFKCTNENDTSQYAMHDRGSLPCNGVSTECPYYTGICWKYCTNERLLPGNKVYAEQLLEVRYYVREYKWTASSYARCFPEQILYPWGGDLLDVPTPEGESDFSIPVVETYLELPETEPTAPVLFEELLVRTKGVVSPGTKVTGSSPQYPSLIKNFNFFDDLPPQVQVRYNLYWPGEDNVCIKYVETNKDIDPLIAIYGKYSPIATALYCINLGKYISNFGPVGIFGSFVDSFEMYTYLVENATSDAAIAVALDLFNTEIESIILNINLYTGADTLLYTNTFDPVQDPDSRSAFWFNLGAPPGATTILVLQKVGSRWTYVIENFIISFVGGILYQTDFSRETSVSEIVSYLPDYAKSIGADHFTASFHLSLVLNNIIPPGEPLLYYNDFMGREAIIPGDYTTPYNYSGHNRLIARKSFSCVRSNITQLGSSLYYVVDLMDDLLTDAIRPWIVEKITFRSEEDEEFEADLEGCGLSIGIAPNQALVKLKHGGFSLCKEITIDFDNVECVIKDTWADSSAESLYLAADWEIMSCYKTPELYDEWDSLLWTASQKQDVRYQIKESGNISNNGIDITCREFKTTLALSCLIKGYSGKISGHTKTKALLWVKQPFCPDIEIIYAHKALARRYWNSPYCFCWSEAPPTNPFYQRDTTYKEIFDKKGVSTNYPPCGDHAGHWQWYPYVQCASFTQYAAGANNSYSSRGEVKGAYSLWGHGKHDIRMEGPDTYSQFVSLYCPPWNCFCTQLTGNWHMDSSAAIWAGKARVQGEITDNTLVKWIEAMSAYGTSVLPKFGNVLRAFMRSYRSTDRIEYKIATLRGIWERESRWLPVPSDYDDVGIYCNRSEFHNSNTTSEGPSPINQLGLIFLELESGVAESAEILSIEDTPLYPGGPLPKTRLRHEEVFGRFSGGAVVYPIANFAYSNGNPLYEFKPYKAKNIQWAWRELQKPVGRSSDPLTNISFIKVEYPYYFMDMNRFEHRLGIDEGPAIITFLPPSFDTETGALEEPASLQLNSGPVRYFDHNGIFDIETEGDSVTQAALYKSCTSGEWLAASSIFNDPGISADTGAADNDDRKIRLYIEPTQTIITRYYHRGLYVTFDDLFNVCNTQKGLLYTDILVKVAAPGKKSLASIFSDVPKCVANQGINEPSFSSYMFDSVISISCSNNLYTCNAPGVLGFGVTVEFETPTAVRGVILEFESGIKESSIPYGATTCYKESQYMVFDTPSVEIYKSQKEQELGGGILGFVNNTSSTYGFGDINSGSNAGYTTCTLERKLYFKDFFLPAKTFTFYVRFAPSPEEIASNFESSNKYAFGTRENILFIRRVVCKSIKVITATLNPIIEPIIVNERKYLVSTGGISSESVAGRVYDEESILDLRSSANTSLIAQADDDSTVWMREKAGTTVGHETEPPLKGPQPKKVYASKTRSRFVGDFYEKAEPLPGEPKYLEAKQKAIFDDIVNQGGTSIYAQCIIPPTLKDYYEDNGLMLTGVPGNWILSISSSIRNIGTVVSYPTFHSEGYKIEPGQPYWQNWLGVCWDYALVNKDTGAVMYGGATLSQLSYFAWGAMATIWRYQSFRAYASLFRYSGGSATNETFAEGTENVTSLGSIDKIRPFIHQSGSNYSLAQYYQYTYWGNYEMAQRMNIGPGWQTLWWGISPSIAAYAMGYDITNY